MLLVALVEIITFWPLLNFSQLFLQSLTPASKHFQTPECALMGLIITSLFTDHLFSPTSLSK